MTWTMSPAEMGEALSRLGWLEGNETDEDALKEYQRWWGIDEDGAGPVTERSLKAERMCGHPDRMALGNQMCRWNRDLINKPLRWYIGGNLPNISKDQFAGAISDALDMWCVHSKIEHKQVNKQSLADTIVTTGVIDGPGKTLAWWELPCGNDRRRKGKVDTREQWVISVNPPANRISLIIVLAHEFGHLLGMGHTSTPNQLMNPTYNPQISRPQMGWDIPQSRMRYGERVPSDDNNDGPPPTVDHAQLSISGDTILFRGKRGRIVWE